MSGMSTSPRYAGPPPSHEDLVVLAERSLASLPAEIVRMVRGVAIRVDDLADETTCRDLDLESPFELLGLYHGIPFGNADAGMVATQPDLIFLYRLPILEYWCETGERLEDIVAHVLVHEIGHHFGFSDADMEAIEAGLR